MLITATILYENGKIIVFVCSFSLKYTYVFMYLTHILFSFQTSPIYTLQSRPSLSLFLDVKLIFLHKNCILTCLVFKNTI